MAISKSDGTPSKWEFPTFDGRVLHYTQRSFDYMGEIGTAVRDLQRLTVLQLPNTLWMKSCILHPTCIHSDVSFTPYTVRARHHSRTMAVLAAFVKTQANLWVAWSGLIPT